MKYLTLFYAVLQAAKEFFQWQRILAEIKSRRLIFEEQERIADEMDKLEADVQAMRRRGQYELVDRLLERQARRLHYWERLPEIGKGSDLYSAKGYGLGHRESDSGEGRTDPGPDSSEPAVAEPDRPAPE